MWSASQATKELHDNVISVVEHADQLWPGEPSIERIQLAEKLEEHDNVHNLNFYFCLPLGSKFGVGLSVKQFGKALHCLCKCSSLGTLSCCIDRA